MAASKRLLTNDHSSIPAAGRKFFVRHHVHAGSVPDPAYYPISTECSFPGSKQSEATSFYSVSNAEVQKE